jgi:hypothetical protein
MFNHGAWSGAFTTNSINGPEDWMKVNQFIRNNDRKLSTRN